MKRCPFSSWHSLKPQTYFCLFVYKHVSFETEGQPISVNV